MADVPPSTATIAAGRLSRFVTVPVLLLDARMNAADPGSVTLLGQRVEYLHLRPQLYVVPKAPETHETFH